MRSQLLAVFSMINLTVSFEIPEFLIENAKICGDPFADPIWIPVLDTCTVSCNAREEYCVENEELAQQCKPLPDDCRKLLEKKLKMGSKKLSRRAALEKLNPHSN